MVAAVKVVIWEEMLYIHLCKRITTGNYVIEKKSSLIIPWIGKLHIPVY